MRKRGVLVLAGGLLGVFASSLLYTRIQAERAIDPEYHPRPDRAPAAQQAAGGLVIREALTAAPQPDLQVEPARPEDIPRSKPIVYRSRLPVLQTLSSSITNSAGDGSVVRTWIVRARFKYPLVRIEERLSAAGEPLAEREMVADHVLVQLQEGASAEDLQAVLAHQGRFEAHIRKAIQSPGLYLVAFDGTD